MTGWQKKEKTDKLDHGIQGQTMESEQKEIEVLFSDDCEEELIGQKRKV